MGILESPSATQIHSDTYFGPTGGGLMISKLSLSENHKNTEIPEVSRNSIIFHEDKEVHGISGTCKKTHGARNSARQIGPDVEKPKEIHTFWRGRFSPGM